MNIDDAYITEAEERASLTQTMPNFRDFQFKRAREEFLALYAAIAKDAYTAPTDWTFSGLSLLNWLIPPTTKEKLTTAEWLLIVLAVLAHDLGMSVHASEAEMHLSSPNFLSFRNFRNQILEDPSSRDFLSHIRVLPPEQREAFYFQEYIRLHHGARAELWLVGSLNKQWSDFVLAQAAKVSESLSLLPTRFRKDLRNLCKFHHNDNLYDTHLFPVCQRYGVGDQEVVNVQYAALLLRTIDTLSIGNGRRPTTAYRVIQFSEPLSVEKWIKEVGPLTVGMKSRSYQESNPDSNTITMSADFTDESAFFAFVEYVAWANREIQMLNRVAESTRQTPDGEHYHYPWLQVDPAAHVEGWSPRPLRFEADRSKILDLLIGHTIYDDPAVAIREMILNAIDAVRFQTYLGTKSGDLETSSTDALGHVLVRWNDHKRELLIEDTGTGMDVDVIQYHLLRAGSSFYTTHAFKLEHTRFVPISRFGIGILSYFMLSDEIEVVSVREAWAYKLRMTSVHSDFLLKEIECQSPDIEGLAPHGTRLRVSVRPSVDMNEAILEEVLRYWVILPECEVIFQRQSGERVQIGYRSVLEATRALYIPTLRKTMGEDYEFSIVDRAIKSHEEQVIEFAFVVTDSQNPKDLMCYGHHNLPATVCLQGIRVDRVFPGCAGESGLASVVSLSGNIGIKPNISRNRIEKTYEYEKAASEIGRVLSDYVCEKASQATDVPLSAWLDVNLGRYAYQNLLSGVNSQEISLQPGVCNLSPSRSKTERRAETHFAASPQAASWRRAIRVFIASPGDLARERERLAMVVEELDKDVGDQIGLTLRLVRWETDAIPEMGRPQALINPLLNEIDIFIGIFGSRFGTPTGRAGSGTEEEFLIAYETWRQYGRPHILLYFRDEPVRVTSRETLDQLSKVLAFKDKVTNKGLFGSFDGIDDLERAVRSHLTQILFRVRSANLGHASIDTDIEAE